MNRLKALGPGLLYAGAAIGVSHLVQSTRAGAEFGFTLLWAVVAANVIKFPFFEFGPRYTAATGKSLISGYRELGKGALLLFLLLTLCTMFIVEAAIISVTAGLAENFFHLGLPIAEWATILLVICSILLLFGRYSLLDNLIKVIILVLSITTIAAFFSSLFGHPHPEAYFKSFEWNQPDHVFFLIALMGWMPAPLDISVWHSVWSVAKNRAQKSRSSLADALFDFRVGYWGTLFMAIFFLSLGALVFFGGTEKVQPSAVGFANQLISLYTDSLGGWAFYIISVAAFTTMFSTALTCLDAFPRVLRPTTKLLFPRWNKASYNKSLYRVWLFITGTGTLLVVIFFMQSMKQLVDVATTISFLTAPVLAILNYQLIFGGRIKKAYVPGKRMKTLSLAGIVFLVGFSLYFLVVRFVF